MCMSCYTSAQSAWQVGQLARGRTSVVWQHYIARVDDQRHIRDCRAVPSAPVPAHRQATMTQQGPHRTMSCPNLARGAPTDICQCSFFKCSTARAAPPRTSPQGTAPARSCTTGSGNHVAGTCMCGLGCSPDGEAQGGACVQVGIRLVPGKPAPHQLALQVHRLEHTA